MHNQYDGQCYFSLPKDFFDKLPKSLQKSLSEHISRYSILSTFPLNPLPHFQQIPGGQDVMKQGCLLLLDKADYHVISGVGRSFAESTGAKAQAEKLQKDSDELKKVQSSMSHLKEFIK
jgi:hypothetical protein